MNSDFNDHSCALLTAFLHTYWHADFIDHNCALLTAFFLLHLLYWSQFRFTDRIFSTLTDLLTLLTTIPLHWPHFCTLTDQLTLLMIIALYWPHFFYTYFTDHNSALLAAFFLHLLYWPQFRFTDRIFSTLNLLTTTPLYWPHFFYTCWLTHHNSALLTAFLYTYWPADYQFALLVAFFVHSPITDLLTLLISIPLFLYTYWPHFCALTDLPTFTDHNSASLTAFFCTLFNIDFPAFPTWTLLNKGNMWLQTSK